MLWCFIVVIATIVFRVDIKPALRENLFQIVISAQKMHDLRLFLSPFSPCFSIQEPNGYRPPDSRGERRLTLQSEPIA
jgi:hypothetical protein